MSTLQKWSNTLNNLSAIYDHFVGWHLKGNPFMYNDKNWLNILHRKIFKVRFGHVFNIIHKRVKYCPPNKMSHSEDREKHFV